MNTPVPHIFEKIEEVVQNTLQELLQSREVEQKVDSCRLDVHMLLGMETLGTTMPEASENSDKSCVGLSPRRNAERIKELEEMLFEKERKKAQEQ